MPTDRDRALTIYQKPPTPARFGALWVSGLITNYCAQEYVLSVVPLPDPDGIPVFIGQYEVHWAVQNLEYFVHIFRVDGSELKPGPNSQ